MTAPVDLVADVIRGNLAGADAEIAQMDAQLVELQAKRDARAREQADFRRLLSAHEVTASAMAEDVALEQASRTEGGVQ